MEQSSENLQLSFSPLSMQTLIIPEEIILGGKSNISSPSSTSEFEGNDNEVDGGLEDEDDPVVKGTTDPGVEISSTFALNEELNCCKGRLDAFGNELKLILAEVTIITGWIQQQFGIQLVNQESLLFKHIYDLDEIEEIATGMSFPENKKINLPAEKLSTTSRSKSTSSRRGRPKTDVTQAEASISSPSKRGRKPKQQLSSQSVLSEDSEADAEDDRANWNPQDFVETMYDKRQEAQSSSRRPRRASTKNINYKETRSAAAEEDFSVGKDVETTTEEVDEDEDYNEQAESTLSSKSKKESATRKPRNRKRKIVDGKDGEGGDPTGVEEEASSEKTEKVKGKAKQDNWESKGPKQCDECGKVVMGTSSLKKHKMMHADERPYPCPECGKTFRDKKNVKIHLIALHNGERHLQCSFCGRKFYAPKDLRIHERTHTGDKPYPCQLCPKRFNVKEHLTMHIRVHTGERPYVCPTCGKAFSQANSLRIHKKIHLRDKEPTPRRPRKTKTPMQVQLISITDSNANTNSSGITEPTGSATGSIIDSDTSLVSSISTFRLCQEFKPPVAMMIAPQNFVMNMTAQVQQQQQQHQQNIADHLTAAATAQQQPEKFVQTAWRMPFSGYTTAEQTARFHLITNPQTQQQEQSLQSTAGVNSSGSPTNLSIRPAASGGTSTATGSENNFTHQQINDPRYFYM